MRQQQPENARLPPTSILQTTYCKGNLLVKCDDGQRCNFNVQAIGCEPKDNPQPADACTDSAHDQCVGEVRERQTWGAVFASHPACHLHAH